MIELILFGVAELKPSPLIQTVIDIKNSQQIEVKPVVTWKDNPNNCNEEIEYIAAEEPFYCIKKQKTINTSTNTNKASKQPVNVSYTTAKPGYYRWGWCTYGVWTLAPWVGEWGDAHLWDNNAIKDGLIVSGVPIVGSVFVDNKGRYGHVGLVIGVKGNSIIVKDMNYRNFGEWTTRTESLDRYVYIYPPNK